jgi:hypothetical protein
MSMSITFNKLLNIWPNPAVKGTRRPQALFKVGGLLGLVNFGLVLQPARPLLLRWALL